MRGVISGGMISALQDRDLRDCFDTVHGSSAGACAAAYFLANQSRLGTRIYYEDVNNKKFIDQSRFLLGKPIMNTHYLIDEIMRFKKPLDVKEVLAQSGALHVITTDVDTGEGRTYADFRDAEHFFQVLKASITIPIIGGGPVTVDGRRLVDGGIVQQVAVKSAMDVGATHILVLMTRRAGELERSADTLFIKTEALALRLLYGAVLGDAYLRRNPGINSMLDFIQKPQDGLVIDSIVREANSLPIERLSTSTDLLKAGDREAQKAVFDYLDKAEKA